MSGESEEDVGYSFQKLCPPPRREGGGMAVQYQSTTAAAAAATASTRPKYEYLQMYTAGSLQTLHTRSTKDVWQHVFGLCPSMPDMFFFFGSAVKAKRPM